MEKAGGIHQARNAGLTGHMVKQTWELTTVGPSSLSWCEADVVLSVPKPKEGIPVKTKLQLQRVSKQADAELIISNVFFKLPLVCQ